MINIVTVNWQNYQGRGAEYVNNLFDMVRRNLPEGLPGRFVCFTDDPKAGYRESIETQPLPANLKGWWTKLFLFSPNLFRTGERVLFFDLDTVITGPLDALANFDGAFAILRDFYRGGSGLQSSVMSWRAGEQTGIWESYAKAGCPDVEGGDQRWIEQHHNKAWTVRLQDVLPGMFVSYKVSGGALPETASVCVFHGSPRPHEVVDGWVPRVWREGGLSHAELKAVCNTATERLLENVKAAASLPLPWFTPAPEHDRHVAIIGGGPSLVDMIHEIKWRQSVGQDVWVLNNAHRALEGSGIGFDVQVLLDARPETAGFVTDASDYLIASQCDPVVFDVVNSRCHTLFHVNSPGMAPILSTETTRPAYLVGGGTTVGMNALALAFLRGYRQIHLYGFDSCYRDGAHHAYSQPLNDGERASECLWNGRTYFCAPWMIGQAQEFIELAPGYMADGAVITVHGKGLLPDIGLSMLGVLSPAQQRAAEVLKRVPAGARGVEVGVFAGQMSAALLRGDSELMLVMVDSWEANGAAYAGDSGDFHATLGEPAQEDFMRQAKERVAFAKGRGDIWRGRSVEAAAHFPDGAADFVFIDADHSYEGCRRDLESWAGKVRVGGWLCGHDYENGDFPKFGVTQAVDEFVNGEGLELELGENFTWFVRMGVQEVPRV